VAEKVMKTSVFRPKTPKICARFQAKEGLIFVKY